MKLFSLINANDPVSLYARFISLVTGQPIQPGAIEAIVIGVEDQGAGLIVSETTLTFAQVQTALFPSLSTVNWTADSTGWNFNYVLNGNNFQTPDNNYLVIVSLVPQGSSAVVQQLVVEIQTRPQ